LGALDNGGRRSPQELTPGLEELAVGMRLMTVFRVAAFAPDEHLTVELHGKVGDVVITYAVLGEGPVRLLMRALWTPPLAPLLGPPAAVGDWVMARRQLLNLRALAERDARREGWAPAARRTG
jgi:hypothetical protein